MHVAIIGGASTIGSTVAYTLASAEPTMDLTLVEKATEAAWAHATDITHSMYHASNAPIEGDGRSFGRIRELGANDMDEIDPDLVIVTAAAPRPDDATDQGARDAELEANVEIADAVAEQLRGIDPAPVLVVTNPIDRITYRLWDRLGWPRNLFLGYSLSETTRAAHAIGRLLDVHSSTVYCPLLGEHGQHVVPAFSKLRVGGKPATLTTEQRADVLEYVRSVPFEIAARRGAAETSRWVTSAGVTRVVQAMDTDGMNATFCLSVPLDGEYGCEDVCLSVPVALSADGVKTILEWDLSPDELDRLQTAAETVRADLETLDGRE